MQRPGRRPPYALTALALLATIPVSLAIPAARRAFGGNVPPLFAKWEPSIGPLVLVPVAIAAAAWWLVRALPRIPTWAVLAGAVVFGWIFSLTLAAQSGGLDAITEPFRRPLDYATDVPLINELGPRAFAHLYPSLIETGALSLHATTHPPGASVLAWVLSRLTGGSVLAMSVIVALIGVAGTAPTYALTREPYGRGAATAAAVLFVSVPGVILFSATSMDAVFMTMIALALAALIRGPRSDGWAAAGGLLTALALGFTFAALAVVPIGVGFWVLAWRGAWAERPAASMSVLARRAAVAVAATIAGVVLLRVLVGVDLVAVLRVTLHAHLLDPSRARSYWYWVLGDVGAFLITAGVAATALIVQGTAGRWRDRRPGLEAILVVILAAAALSGLFRGEVDHIWLFLIPLVAAVAGGGIAGGPATGLDDASASRLRLAVVIGLAQAILMEVLLFTFW